MNTPVKLLVGFSSIGGITGGAIALSNYLSNEESIEKQLKDKGFRILEKTDSEWEKIFNSYKSPTAKLKFSGADINNKEELQKRCAEILNKNASENNDTNNYLEKTKKWCIVPNKVEDKVTERKILVISKAEDKEDQEAWNDKVVAYTATNNQNKINDLNFENKPILKGAVTVKHREGFKDACNKLINKKSYEEDYQEAIEKAKKWCTKEG